MVNWDGESQERREKAGWSYGLTGPYWSETSQRIRKAAVQDVEKIKTYLGLKWKFANIADFWWLASLLEDAIGHWIWTYIRLGQQVSRFRKWFL